MSTLEMIMMVSDYRDLNLVIIKQDLRMETSENSLLALLLLNDLYCIFQKCIFSSYFILSFRHAAKKLVILLCTHL